MKCSHSHMRGAARLRATPPVRGRDIGGWGIALIVLHLLCHEVPMIAAMLCAVFN